MVVEVRCVMLEHISKERRTIHLVLSDAGELAAKRGQLWVQFGADKAGKLHLRRTMGQCEGQSVLCNPLTLSCGCYATHTNTSLRTSSHRRPDTAS